jgi:hypothetical protein
MTQEDKKLLLQDLCARLPYGVKCQFEDTVRVTDGESDPFYDYVLSARDLELFINHKNFYIKPYLRPISSMTEEEMDRLFDILHIDKDGKDEDWIKINDVYGIKFFFPTGKWIENIAEAYDYLYSIHIDFRGLIHKGLAIEAPEGMYNLNCNK